MAVKIWIVILVQTSYKIMPWYPEDKGRMDVLLKRRFLQLYTPLQSRWSISTSHLYVRYSRLTTRFTKFVYASPRVTARLYVPPIVTFFILWHKHSSLFRLHILVPDFPMSASFLASFWFICYCRTCLCIVSSIILPKWFIQFCLCSLISYFAPSVF
jgi:hypothetical protein